MSSGGTSSGSGSGEKDKDSHWYFSAEQLTNSPSRRQGIDADTELSYRQMTAYLIQEMGQRLQVSQLCINTAIVYMHRFYAFHSFTHFHRNNIAAASLFLAAKVEEQPRKLEHVIKAANKCLSQPTSSTTDAYYIEQAQELVFNENVLLQTLGFDVAIDHPHTHVVKTCHLVKACKDLAQTSYFLASNSLHLTSMCLQYKPTVVACFCIYLACKWSRWEIPQSTEGKHWFHYVDKTVTMDLLKQLTDEFIAIYEKSPSRLKSKLNSIKALAQNASNRVINSKEKKEEWKMGDMMKMYAHDTPGSGGSSGGNNNQPYSTSSLGMEQSQQQSSALLPPPPPQTQLPRKSELHSGQHRSHHNSSSHHSKINFPSSDVLDHKSSHKQPPFSGVVSRPRDHTQSSQGHQQPLIAGSSSRSSLSTSSGRSLSSLPGQNLPRQTSQGHQLDVNYHKSREKSNLIGSYPHTAPSQPHSGLKVSQKQESNRVMQKEQTTVKMPEPGKSGSNNSSNANKLFPPTSSMSAMSQYGSNVSQAQNKLDISQDMSRNLMHGQRGYGINNGSGNAPLLGSYQTQHARQSSNSNSNKHDLSKPASVHLQQHGKQPSIPTESAYATGTLESQLPAPHAQTHATAGYLNIRPPEASSNEDNSTTQLPLVHAILQQPTNANQPKTSLFSPDWSEKLQPQQPQQIIAGNNYANTSIPPPSGSDAFNYKIPLNKDGEREKGMDVSAASIKKERNRGTHAGLDLTGSMMLGVRPNAPQSQFHQHMTQQQSFKISMPKKVDSNIMGDLTGINAAVKRPNEGAYKHDEEQNKIRKLDTQTTLSSYNDLKTSETNKLHVVNGIETNPDLVRSLLKESLCTSNALLKTEQLGVPSLQPPAELFEPSAMATSTIAAPIAETSLKSSCFSGAEPSSVEVSESSSSKAEKKKKKDKHKHKEKDKDKSKDREERKKHKKDKDKHKERDRGEIDSSEHVKIKISKDKIEGSAESLKIKIPKDRIISDTNNSSGNINNSADSGGTIAHPAPALKIKISKDKLENYATESATHSSSQQVHALAQPTTGFYSSFVTPNNALGLMSHSSSGSSSSGKKKDRDRDKDRERDKEKKRGSNEIVKSNGSGSFHSASTLQGGAGGPLLTHLPPTTNTTSKSQNPNKMQQLSSNMNQLFGESNDDDDDYDDNKGVNHKIYKDCHKNRVQNSDSFTSISASTNSAGSIRKGTDYGSKYSQSQQYNQR